MFLCPNKRGKNELSIEEFSYLWASPLDRRHLGKTQINLVFRSVCTIFAKENVEIMCTVSINIDETMLQELKPELDGNAAIRLWAQRMIDLCIQQLEYEDNETISVEEARAMTLAAVREEYARP